MTTFANHPVFKNLPLAAAQLDGKTQTVEAQMLVGREPGCKVWFGDKMYTFERAFNKAGTVRCFVKETWRPQIVASTQPLVILP